LVGEVIEFSDEGLSSARRISKAAFDYARLWVVIDPSAYLGSNTPVCHDSCFLYGPRAFGGFAAFMIAQWFSMFSSVDGEPMATLMVTFGTFLISWR